MSGNTKTNGAGNLSLVPGIIDTKREAEGEWFDHDKVPGFEKHLVDADGNGLVGVKVRSPHTGAYRREELDVQTRALRKTEQKRFQFLSDEVTRMHAEYCVVDWKFTDSNGEPVVFSIENVLLVYEATGAEGILLYRNHRGWIEACLAALTGEIEEQKETDEGKSESASATS